MKRLILIFVLLMMAAISHPHAGEAASLNEIFLFKATAETGDGTYHWEYNSPDNFEYHAKGKAMHASQAKDQVVNIYKQASLSSDTDKNDLAKAFKDAGYEDMERLDVHWQDENGDLYTWLWEKNEE